MESTLENLKSLLKTIQRETVPFIGHPDPGAINDCWNEVFDMINEMSNSE